MSLGSVLYFIPSIFVESWNTSLTVQLIDLRFSYILLVLHHLHQLLLRVAKVCLRLKAVGCDRTLVINSGGERLILDLSKEFLPVVREYLNLHTLRIKNMVYVLSNVLPAILYRFSTPHGTANFSEISRCLATSFSLCSWSEPCLSLALGVRSIAYLLGSHCVVYFPHSVKRYSSSLSPSCSWPDLPTYPE